MTPEQIQKMKACICAAAPRPMKTRRVKAQIYYGHGRPFFKQPIEDAEQDAYYVLPADADSYERMVEQMAKIIRRNWTGHVEQDVVLALRAIGITAPKQKK